MNKSKKIVLGATIKLYDVTPSIPVGFINITSIYWHIMIFALNVKF